MRGRGRGSQPSEADRLRRRRTRRAHLFSRLERCHSFKRAAASPGPGGERGGGLSFDGLSFARALARWCVATGDMYAPGFPKCIASRYGICRDFVFAEAGRGGCSSCVCVCVSGRLPPLLFTPSTAARSDASRYLASERSERSTIGVLVGR